MILHPFESPNPVHHKYKNSEWRRTAPHDIKHPDFLWEDYWQRFNTMQIPLFDEDEYYDTAIAIASESSDRQEFEQRFERKNRQQREKLLAIMNRALEDALANAETFKSNDAWLTAIYASQTGCLQYFVRLLEAAASGREAVLVEADVEHEAPWSTDAGENMSEKTRNPWGEARDVVPGAQAHADHRGYPYMNGPMPRNWAAQHPDDYEWNYKTRSECNGRDQTPSDDFVIAVPAVEYTTSKSDGTAPDSTSRTSSVQQPLPPISSDRHLLAKDDEEAIQEAPASPLRDDGSTTLAKKRVRSDEDTTVRDPKRRKLAHDVAPTPTTRQAPRKRSRSEDDREDNGYKRQKIESLPSPPTSHTSSAESGEDTTTDDAPPVSPSNASASNEPRSPSESSETPGADTTDGKRKRRKRASVSRTTRAKTCQPSPTSRSSRRGKSSTLWELDPSGKPHSIS